MSNYTAAKYDLRELYRRIYFVGTNFVNTAAKYNYQAAPFIDGNQGVNLENYVPGLRWASGLLGTPLFMPTKIKAKESDEWYQLPNTPLVEINGKKNIVKTPIDGNDGTFKQLWSLDDYEISIRGIAIDEENQDEYPSEIMYNIRALFEERKSIIILNELTTIFGINYMSVETLSIPAVEGAETYQQYIITGCSDKNFDLELKKPANA